MFNRLLRLGVNMHPERSDHKWTWCEQQKAPQQQEQYGSLNLPVLAAGVGEHTADSLYKLHDFRSCCAKEEQLVFCVLCHGK